MINVSYSSTKQRRLVKVGNKVVGTLENNRFIKQVVGSKHRLRFPPAWAIDATAFDTEVKPNATEIVVMDRETDIDYHCSVEAFDRLKGELDRGFGRQYFLPINYWDVRGTDHRQLAFWGDESNA